MYIQEPLLRDVKPFAPARLLWLFPYEFQRAIQAEARHNSFITTSTTTTTTTITHSPYDVRMIPFFVNVAEFMTTLCLVAFQGQIWIKVYAVFVLPFRLISAFKAVDAFHIDTTTIQEVFGPISSRFGGGGGSSSSSSSAEGTTQAIEQTVSQFPNLVIREDGGRKEGRYPMAFIPTTI